MYIQDTNALEYLAVSEALFEEVLAKDPWIEAIGEPFELRFSEAGRLQNRWEKGKLVL